MPYDDGLVNVYGRLQEVTVSMYSGRPWLVNIAGYCLAGRCRTIAPASNPRVQAVLGLRMASHCGASVAPGDWRRESRGGDAAKLGAKCGLLLQVIQMIASAGRRAFPGALPASFLS